MYPSRKRNETLLEKEIAKNRKILLRMPQENDQLLAIRSWIKTPAVYVIEEDLVPQLAKRDPYFEDIDWYKLKLPSAFLLDLSESKFFFSSSKDQNHKIMPHGINSVMVSFLKEKGRDSKGNYIYSLGTCHNFDFLALHMRYLGDPNEPEILKSAMNLTDPTLTKDTMIFSADYKDECEFSFMEEMLAPKIEMLCKEYNISQDERESYSDRYVEAVSPTVIAGESKENLDKKYTKSILLRGIYKKLTAIIMESNTLSLKESRGLIVRNIVFSFLKSLSDKLILPRKLKDKGSFRTRQKSKSKPRNYNYITVDFRKLKTLKRTPPRDPQTQDTVKNGRAKSTFQSEVDNFTAFRWVYLDDVPDNESVYAIKSAKDGERLLGKVRRPISGHTRNKHLPKRTAPKLTKVKGL